MVQEAVDDANHNAKLNSEYTRVGSTLNKWRPEQNGSHFAGNIFICIDWNYNVLI